MQNEYEIKKEMCEIGKRVYNRGMVAANDGKLLRKNQRERSIMYTNRGQQRFYDT